MRKKNFFKTVIFGFLLTGVLHLLLPVSCKVLGDVDPAPIIKEIEIDTKGLNKSTSELETALLGEDVAQVQSMLSPDASERLNNVIPKLKPYLKDFGTAYKTRKLEFATPIYAEYSFTFKDRTVSVAFSRNDSGTWKLMRL
jgi:hypothetical protein